MERQLSLAKLLEKRRKIEEELKRRNDLPEWDFRQIHIVCQLKVVRTGRWREEGRHLGWSADEDYRNIVAMVVLRCELHGVESAEFEGKPYRADLP